MEYNPFGLKRVYENKGFIPITYDLMFKLILLEHPVFAEEIMYETLPIRRGSIVDLENRNTELIPDNFLIKVCHLDLLYSVKIKADNGDVLSHLVNIESHHSRMPDIVKKCAIYGARVFGLQLPRGSKRYGNVNNSYSIVMAQHKIPELKATMLYHHHHENHNVWDPKSQISIPGTKFSFVELAKLRVCPATHFQEGAV